MEEFRSGVRGGATPGVERLPVLKVVAETEISDLGVHIEIKEEVLSLQVTMNHLEQGRGRRASVIQSINQFGFLFWFLSKMSYVAGVAKINSRHNLPEVAPGILLLHSAMRHQVIKELAALGILHDQKNLLWGVNDLVQPGNVRVVQGLHDSHLTHQFLSSGSGNLLFFEISSVSLCLAI